MKPRLALKPVTTKKIKSKNTKTLPYKTPYLQLHLTLSNYRKAMWMLSTALICGAFPQLVVVYLRIASRWQLQSWKLIANQLFMMKTVANILMVKQLGRGSSIWKVSVSFLKKILG